MVIWRNESIRQHIKGKAPLWPLIEWENERLTINRTPPRFAPLSEYIEGQGRYKHLQEEDLIAISNARDSRWKQLQSWVRESA